MGESREILEVGAEEAIFAFPPPLRQAPPVGSREAGLILAGNAAATGLAYLGYRVALCGVSRFGQPNIALRVLLISAHAMAAEGVPQDATSPLLRAAGSVLGAAVEAALVGAQLVFWVPATTTLSLVPAGWLGFVCVLALPAAAASLVATYVLLAQSPQASALFARAGLPRAGQLATRHGGLLLAGSVLGAGLVMLSTFQAAPAWMVSRYLTPIWLAFAAGSQMQQTHQTMVHLKDADQGEWFDHLGAATEAVRSVSRTLLLTAGLGAHWAGCNRLGVNPLLARALRPAS